MTTFFMSTSLSAHSVAVAHGVHSMTLEDVRYYFRSDASAQNGIPTLNTNLSSPQHVLRHTPASGYDTSLTTIAMRHMDKVMQILMHRRWAWNTKLWHDSLCVFTRNRVLSR